MIPDPTDPSPPDIYADGISVGAGVFGYTLTFLLSSPMRPAGDSGLQASPVAHIRVSPTLAKSIAEAITRTLATLPEPTVIIDQKIEAPGGEAT